jgi:hypothetical protein
MMPYKDKYIVLKIKAGILFKSIYKRIINLDMKKQLNCMIKC